MPTTALTRMQQKIMTFMPVIHGKFFPWFLSGPVVIHVSNLGPT